MIARNTLLFAALPALLALAAAFVAQYGFGLRPCHLCVLQRYPYAVALAAGAALWLLCPGDRWLRIGLALLLLLYLADSGLAMYHTAVEQKLIPGPESCTVQAGQGGSIEDLRNQILAAPVIACDTPAFVFLGLSMAAWNALYAAAAAGFVFWIMRGRHDASRNA